MWTAQTSLPRGNLLGRLITTLTEVILQTRVIRDRPVVGLLHAVLVWGFFVFAWVSVEHIYQGFIGLEYAVPDRSWYGSFAAVWAIAVLIGVGGLIYRRFVMRPLQLGLISVSSAFVSVFIVLLMMTYLLGWRGLEVGSLLWNINWWAHLLLLVGMLILIAKSKHLHLILGPAAIFFRSDTTSSMRALREGDDEDFGMLHFGDLSAKDVLDVNSCVECGRCTDVCPANAIGETLNPKEVILQMQRGLLGGAEIIAGTTSEVQRGDAWIREEDLFQCLSCGACEQACPVGIEHVGAKILDLRRGLVSEGRTHSDSVAELFTAMERTPHNPWKISHDVRKNFIEAEQFPVFDSKKEWLLWLGCGNSYDSHGQDVVRAVAKILDAAGASWGVFRNETCCGEPARRAGNEYLYMELSEKVIESFRSCEVKNLVTCCPHCTQMFDVDYRQNETFEALGIRILHHTELIEQLHERLALQPASEMVTYHDPCYLARGRGVTKQPRALLETCGVKPIEPTQNGKDAFCCGAGGAQIFITEDKTDVPNRRVNHKRFSQLADTGATTVAVACPYCPIMLNDAAQHAGREDIRVVDIAEIVVERLAPSG
tara:strand:+ start:66242 stop:68035 length:1794 start_codon:yes stop_codon:yes gene_type:complete